MGDLIVIDGGAGRHNGDVARSLRELADMVENDPKDIVSIGLVIAHRDGTVEFEFSGSMLITLLGGVSCLEKEIWKDL